MRWADLDLLGHVNNVNYFSFFDTAVTYYEMSAGVVDLLNDPVHCVVAGVESDTALVAQCRAGDERGHASGADAADPRGSRPH